MNLNDFIIGFILGFLSSILASFIFYYFIVHLPRKNDKKNIQEHTAPLIRAIVGQGKVVFQTLLKEADLERDFQNISLGDIQFLGPKIKLKKESPPIIDFFILNKANFAQYLWFYKDRTVTNVEKVLIYIPFLDSGLIKRLNRVLYCRYFNSCDVWLKSLDFVSDPDLTSFSEDLHEYYNAIRELEIFATDSKII